MAFGRLIMGILVPEYTTKWGMTMPVYMSHACKEIRIAPLHGQGPENHWALYADFGVYRSREDRLKNPYGAILDTVHVMTVVSSTAFDTSTIFQLLYAKLMEMYADAEMENSITQGDGMVAHPTLTPIPDSQPPPPAESDPTAPVVPDPTYVPDPMHAS